MESNAVSDLTSDGTHIGVDRGDVDGNVRVFDRAGVKQRDHQVELVMVAVVIERHTVLPASPHSAHSKDVVAHTGRWRCPFHAETTTDVSAHLGAEPQGDSPARHLLQGPGRHRGDSGGAGERHGDRRSEAQGRSSGGCEGEQLVWIFFCFVGVKFDVFFRMVQYEMVCSMLKYVYSMLKYLNRSVRNYSPSSYVDASFEFISDRNILHFSVRRHAAIILLTFWRSFTPLNDYAVKW